MIHNITQPVKEDAKQRKTTTQVVKHEVEEEKLDNNITLRRTTIEEIELPPGVDADNVKKTDQDSGPKS